MGKEYTDLSVSDIDWWHSSYAEFEDFLGLGDERVLALADALRERGKSYYIINRLLRANSLPHGPCNMIEEQRMIEQGKNNG